jgi:O-antigen/teichoic acid export membrane protein
MMSDSATASPANAQPAAQPTPSLTAQAFWLIVARAIGFVFTIGLPIVIVRVFSPREFGMYKQAFVVVGTAVTVLPFSVGMSAFYFLARRPEKQREVVFNILLYHIIVGGFAWGVLAFSPTTLALILGRETPLVPYAGIIGATIFTWVVASFLELVATAMADVVYSTGFIIAAQASRAILILAAAALGRTVDAVIYAACLHGMLQCCVLLWYLQHRFAGFWKHFDKAMAIEQFWYVLPFGLTGVVYSIQADLHNYLVANKFSPADYAIYAVGTAPVPFVGILANAVNSVLLPRISKLQHDGNREEILELMLRSWRKVAVLIFPMCCALLALGYEFILVLYTARYEASWPIFALNLSLLAIGVLVTDAVIRGHTELRSWMLITRGVGFVVQIAVSLLAIPIFGMAGALIGIIVASVVDRLIMVHALFRLLGFSRRHFQNLKGMAGLAVAAGVAAAAAVGAKWMVSNYVPIVRLGCGALVFGIVYLALIFILRLLEPEEKELVNRYLRRFAALRPTLNRA